MHFIPLSEDQLRQFIDAESVFTALEQARLSAKEARGSMFWRTDKGKDYLVRASTSAAQQRLGPRSAGTEGMYERFTTRKTAIASRVKSLTQSLERHQRLNRALRVGRCPALLVNILQRLEQHGMAAHFLTVGTHALYAFEAAAGVRIAAEALATQDVDVLFDTRKRVTFFERMEETGLSFIDLLRKADKTFEIDPLQRHTAVNQHGFEVDIIRRVAKDGDPHPLRMSHHEIDMWAVQVGSGERMLGTKKFSQVIVATDGTMARMTTISPKTFVTIKRALSNSASRDPKKRDKDALQALVVAQLMKDHMIDRLGRSPAPIAASDVGVAPLSATRAKQVTVRKSAAYPRPFKNR